MEEVWKDIEGYEGLYQVSNLGRVKSLRRDIIMRPRVYGGYYHVALSKGHKKYIVPSVHHLVYRAFIGPYTTSRYIVIDHINGDRLDNRAENLQKISASENIAKAITHRKENLPHGVYRGDNGYGPFLTARVPFGGKYLHLGVFNTVEDAVKAREDALLAISKVEEIKTARQHFYPKNGCKVCSCCKQEKPLSEFYTNGKNSYRGKCKDCSREYKRSFRNAGKFDKEVLFTIKTQSL